MFSEQRQTEHCQWREMHFTWKRMLSIQEEKKMPHSIQIVFIHSCVYYTHWYFVGVRVIKSIWRILLCTWLNCVQCEPNKWAWKREHINKIEVNWICLDFIEMLCVCVRPIWMRQYYVMHVRWIDTFVVSRQIAPLSHRILSSLWTRIPESNSKLL